MWQPQAYALTQGFKPQVNFHLHKLKVSHISKIVFTYRHNVYATEALAVLNIKNFTKSLLLFLNNSVNMKRLNLIVYKPLRDRDLSSVRRLVSVDGSKLSFFVKHTHVKMPISVNTLNV